jgi:hypothetical protein
MPLDKQLLRPAVMPKDKRGWLAIGPTDARSVNAPIVARAVYPLGHLDFPRARWIIPIRRPRLAQACTTRASSKIVRRLQIGTISQ